MTAGQAVAFADGMRVGLHGRVRRAWAPRGVKVRQRVQLRYEWRYLALAVDPLAGALRWRWLPNMKQEAVAEAAGAWRDDGLAAIVWGGAPGHRAKAVRAAGPVLVTQPPAAPELNPPERLFQELRRAVEGRVYATLADKVAAVERELAALAADEPRPRRLVGWAWIAENLSRLPPAANPAHS